MPVWLLGLLANPKIDKMLYYFGSKFWAAAYKAVCDWINQLKQSIVDKHNVAQYQDDVKVDPAQPNKPPPKTDEEIIQDGQDLLNGRPKP